MKIRLLLSCLAVGAFLQCSFAQFTTVTVNGSVSNVEYGGANNNTGNIYLTWDNTNLYVGMSSANVAEAMVMYLDKDVLTPINGGSNSNGTTVGQSYDGTSFAELPFRADFVTYIKNSYREYRTADGSNSWSSATSAYGTYSDNASNVREIAIPWSIIGGRPTSFAFFVYATSGGGFVYNQYPTENASGSIGTSARYVRYYVVNSTANGSSTAPFSRNSYVFNSTTDVTVNDITVYDFTMNTSSRTLTKGGTANWTINGNLVVGNGTLDFNTSTGTCDVYNSVNVSGGTLNLNAKKLALKSSSSGTAYVAQVSGTISNATNVTVERYIPAKRAWRFLTAPLTGSSNNTLYYNWQNNGTTGTGVELWTSAGNGGSADPNNAASGLAIGTSSNVLSYNGGWVAVTNSKTTNLFTSSDNNAYCVFVTGPFQNGSGNITSGATATTLSATGTLRTGNTTVNLGSLAADQYALVGNPFASPVDPSVLTGTNLKSSFWMWDPNLAGTYGFGGYVTFNRATNQYNIISASYSNSPLSQIQSGQAFFVQATAAASTDITFDEADKTTTVNNAQFRNTANGFEQIRVTLQKDFASNNNFTSVDAVVAVFHASIGQKGIDSYDISKLNNSGENIGLVRSATNLVFEHRPMVTDKDTIYLKIWNTTAANYRLYIQPEDISAMAGITAVLKDNYLNTESPISLSTATTINFSVDANASSSGDRFVIYFRPSAPLPVEYTAIKASPLENKIKVEWSVANEKNISNYIVEKSKDGKSFDKAASVTATGAAVYNWIDNTPNQDINYYRVKSIGLNGETQYSNIVKISNRNLQPVFTAYPNPVKGNSFEVNITSGEKGVFTMRMFNATGELQLQQVMPHNGGTAVQRIMLPSVLPSGIYLLELKTGTATFTKTIMIR